MVLVTLVVALASLLYQSSHETGSVKLPLISVREEAGKRDSPASCEEKRDSQDSCEEKRDSPASFEEKRDSPASCQEKRDSPASCEEDFIEEEREQAGRVATLQQQCQLWKRRLGKQPSFDNGYIQRLRQIT